MWVKIRNIENYYDMNNLFDNPPLLILGMHRSGTTLLVEILMKLGYFSGANSFRPLINSPVARSNLPTTLLIEISGL